MSSIPLHSKMKDLYPSSNSTTTQTTTTITSSSSSILMFKWLRHGWTTSKDIFKVYWQAYPLFRAFVYLFMLFTAIPNLLFCFYLLGCLILGLCVTVIGISFVQGGLLFLGLLFLAPILIGSMFLAGLLVMIVYSVSYLLRLRPTTNATSSHFLINPEQMLAQWYYQVLPNPILGHSTPTPC